MLALIALSKAGFCHGDVKDSNIMLTPYDKHCKRVRSCYGDHSYYEVTLVDFGSAQRYDKVKHHSCLAKLLITFVQQEPSRSDTLSRNYTALSRSVSCGLLMYRRDLPMLHPCPQLSSWLC